MSRSEYITKMTFKRKKDEKRCFLFNFFLNYYKQLGRFYTDYPQIGLLKKRNNRGGFQPQKPTQ